MSAAGPDSVNTMIKTVSIMLLLFLCFLFELFTDWEQRGSGSVSNTTDGFWQWMVDRCSVWPVTKEFRCGRAGGTLCP